MAQDVTALPSAGADVRLGNLRNQLDRSFQGPQQRTVAPGWTTSASIGVDGAYSDGVSASTGGRPGGFFYTTVTPTIGVQGDAQRLSGSLFYAPQLREYPSSQSQSGIDHNLNAGGRLTVLPELAFIDVRAASGIQSRSGGLGPNGTSTIARQDQVQTTSLSIAPRVQYRFDTFGQLIAGYTFSKTSFTGTQPLVASPFVSPQANQSLTSTTPSIAFYTGDDWGRFNGSAAVQHTQNSGQGVLSHSHQNTETVSGIYALSRVWALTGSVGHENIAYGGTTPLRINGITWSGGVRVTPDQDTVLSLSYGKKSGHPSLSMSARAQLSPRTRISAQYIEALGSQAEGFQNALAGSSIDSGGTSISNATGEPIGLNGNFNGVQGGLTRSKVASITLSWLLNRDAFLFTVSRDQEAILSNSIAGGPSATSGVNGSLGWQHDFSENLNGSVFVQYGKRSASGRTSANQDSMTGYMSLNYIVSQTLTTHIQYSHTKLTSPVPTQSSGQNMLLFGLLKSF